MLRAHLLQIDGQVEQQALFGVTDLHPECSAELDARLRVRLGLRRLSSSCQALPHGPSQRPADAAPTLLRQYRDLDLGRLSGDGLRPRCPSRPAEIGRASCRERADVSGRDMYNM